MMVLLTVAIGYAVAPHAASSGWTLLHVLFGALLSCSGAGALNQYLERDTDSFMDRTRFRPLPTQRVSPALVLCFGSALSLAGVGYLLATTNLLTAAINATTLLVYLFVYTPMKLTTPLSTLVGAIPGALPPVMGWAAAANSIGSGAVVLFAILFLWQIPHFLAIGRLYRADYSSGGMPMLVVVDADGRATGRQMVIYSLALIPVSLSATLLGITGPIFFWLALLAGLAYLLASLCAAWISDRASARRLLLASILYLPVLFAAMFIDRLLG